MSPSIELKTGQTVVTKFGEKLEVLDLKTLPAKTKKGEVIESSAQMFLAKSGDNLCWFPVENIKEVL